MKNNIWLGIGAIVVSVVLLTIVLNKVNQPEQINSETDTSLGTTTSTIGTTNEPVVVLIPTSTPITPKPLPAPTPISSSPEHSPFGSEFTVTTNNRVVLADGLALTLDKINDSRCKEGVQCIWAGELAPTITLKNGNFFTTVKTVMLGTVRTQSIITNGYVIKLISATTNSATFVVTKGGISPTMELGTVSGSVTLSPNCPVEKAGEPCETTREMYTSRSVVIYMSDGVTVEHKQPLEPNGTFSLPLIPDSYFVQIDPAGIGAGEKKPVTIKPLQTTTIHFDIDTGIR